MVLDSDRPQEEPRLIEERLSVFDKRLIGRHLIFSLAVILLYLLLNRPEVIMVSQLGFTVWFPAVHHANRRKKNLSTRFARVAV